MSLPSLGGFGNPNKKTAKNAKQQLWYRDRSAAEEQMTHSMPTRQDMETVAEPAQPPASIAQGSTRKLQGSCVQPFGAINLPMIQATCKSHVKLLTAGWTFLSLALLVSPSTNPLDPSSLHWNGDIATFHSLLDWDITPGRVIEGILAAMPLVALSNVIGNSNHAELCPIHFTVTNTVISLFGRRHSEGTNTMMVLLLSLGIGTVSALSEELIFRGLLPTTLVAYSHSVELALIAQACLFGLGQVRRKSSLIENGTFSIMQSLNGLWYGTVYLATGGDILPVLVAHLLSECHVFVGTWKMVNDQLDYTEKHAKDLSSSEQLELDSIQQEAGGNLQPGTLDHCRRFFYAFDYDHEGALSLANVKRAVAYAFFHDPVKPSDSQTTTAFQQILRARAVPGVPGQLSGSSKVDADRITLSEFLHLLFNLKSKAHATSTEQPV